MQIDNTEFLQLQQEVGRELTCENCNCKFYVIGRRCKASFYKVPLADNNSNAIDPTMFSNPYICRHFWWASSIALAYRESQFLKVLSCKNRALKCTKSDTDWAECYKCNNYEKVE